MNNPRLLTDEEIDEAHERGFCSLKDGDTGIVCLREVAKDQDARSFALGVEAGKASRKLPSVEEIAEVINDYILHKVSHLLTQAQIQELASAILAL
mgnify:CR=1 FL=1